MVSEKKKRSHRNGFVCRGMLKNSDQIRCKKFQKYTSSQRKKEKNVKEIK